MKQKTIAQEITFTGTGLHSGESSAITVKPAEPNTAYTIRIKDQECKASLSGSHSGFCSAVAIGSERVHTVEHLFAALFGLEIDNVLIEIAGNEIPGLDGSAKVFADKILEAGITEQDAEAKVIRLTKAITVYGKNGACLTALPSEDDLLHIDYTLDYSESNLLRGTSKFKISPEVFEREIAPARTFVPKAHVEYMRTAGFGKGANETNTLVLDVNSVVGNTLRFPDEPIRHKILDILGDLSLVGRRLAVRLIGYKSGHELNQKLGHELLSEVSRQENPHGLMDIRTIESRLPHRYPFLLVDRVLEFEKGKWIKTIKCVTRNEEFFNGHFPGQPIMPGVLQIEALAQSAGILMSLDPAADGKLAVLAAVTDVRFRRPVVPGDVIDMRVDFEKFHGRRGIGIVKAQSTINGDPAAECRITFSLVEPAQYT